MSDTVRDDDLLGRLRLADPVDLAEMGQAVAPLRDRIKARAIALGSTPSEPIPAGDRVAVEAGSRGERGRFRGRRRWLPLGFASLACAAVLAAVLVFSGSSIDSGPGAHPGFADAAVKVAEANPRLLITAPGWRIVEARSFKPQRAAETRRRHPSGPPLLGPRRRSARDALQQRRRRAGGGDLERNDIGAEDDRLPPRSGPDGQLLHDGLPGRRRRFRRARRRFREAERMGGADG
jgi:hypothetical protein